MCCPYKQTVCEPMLQLSKSQYKDLCTECASKMMSGSGADTESAAESAIIGKPSSAPAPAAAAAAAAQSSTARPGRSGVPRQTRMRGSGYDMGLMAPHPLASSGIATAPAWSSALAPAGSMIAQTPRIAGVY